MEQFSSWLTSFFISLYFFSTQSYFASTFPFSFCHYPKTQSSSLSLFFSSLVSWTRLYVWMDISGNDLALWLYLIVISLSFIFDHVIHCSFMLFDLVEPENNFSLNLFNFYRHFKSTPFHILIHVRTISYFSFSYHCFLWSMWSLAWSMRQA
jgi:hypothetical protein